MDDAPQELADVVERKRRILLLVEETLGRLRLPDLDESFWDAMRGDLLAFGATERELDAVVVHLLGVIVEMTGDDEERHQQFQLISTYLAGTDMQITIAKDDSYIRINFPQRKHVH
jgi:hypothetical protein